MENSNDINNTTIENNNTIEPEVKKKISQALKDGQKRYYNKIKSTPEFQELRRAYSKKHYEKNTGELTQEQYDKYNNRLLNRLAHLHLSS